MEEILATVFLQLLNRSITAGWIVLAILLLRLFLKKAPKWITVALWGMVAFRLLCPFSFKSVLSLIPSAETVSPGIMTAQTPTVNTGVPILNEALNYALKTNLSPATGDSANPLQIWIPLLAAVWVVGIVILLAHTAVSYLRLRRKVSTAVLLRENVYQTEHAVSPFALGAIKPKIYLPFHLREQDAEHVIAHEQAHIRRKDHWWKPLGFLLLTLHWFHPLLWVGYLLLCKDIELACDEKVIKELNRDRKADYSQALLTCSVRRRTPSACPLAFGETGVKSRVKSVLHYKKPAVWVIAVAVVLCVALAACALTDPKIKYQGSVACRVTRDDYFIEYDLTEDAMEKIVSLLNNGNWVDDVPNCACDYEFRMDRELIQYHSECGTFVDAVNGRSFTLSAEEKADFERIFRIEKTES